MKNIETKICEKCRKRFEKNYKYSKKQWSRAKFCSIKCLNLSRKGKTTSENFRMVKYCKQCGKKFNRNKKFSDRQWKNAEFCSRKCSSMNEEKRQKARIISLKNGNIPPIHIGENNINWKGGISSENNKIRNSIEMRLWREAVFARDSWTCQKYGIKGGILRAHHIYNFSNFPELRTSIENGITLSEKAHKEFHKKYGKKDNTQEQLEEFLKNKVNKIIRKN